MISRLGLALEKAQAVWLRDSAKLSEEIHEAKRDWSIEMDGETRGVARRLALGLEEQRRQMDDLDRKIVAAKVELGGFGERLEACARAQQQELRDSEARGQRQMNDVQTMQRPGHRAHRGVGRGWAARSRRSSTSRRSWRSWSRPHSNGSAAFRRARSAGLGAFGDKDHVGSANFIDSNLNCIYMYIQYIHIMLTYI